MSPFDANSSEQQARELGACLRSAAEQDASLDHFALEGERLRRAVGQISREPADSRAVRHGRSLVLAAAAAVLVIVSLGAGVWRMLQISPLAFEVVGPGRVSETYFVSPPGQSTLLKFSDGSTVVAQPNARLRVPEVHADGATLMLDSGKASVSVVHRRANTHWTVVAGAYAIAVIGTKFELEWQPSFDRLTIDMSEGQIEVGGPKIASPVTVRGGQHFEATSNAGWAVTPIVDIKPVPESSAGAPALVTRAIQHDPSTADNSGTVPRAESLAVVATVPGSRSVAHSTSTASGTVLTPSSSATPPAAEPSTNSAIVLADPQALSWTRLLARGDSQRVIAEAEAMGQKSCFSQCSSADLRALADAARYSGRLDMAEAALRAVRERFPAQAPVAAYLLASVDEARGRNASALRWYETYLAEAPRGGFLSEALAGRLRMLVATNGYTSARKAAREYLELFPNGVGAKTATQVLQSR